MKISSWNAWLVDEGVSVLDTNNSWSLGRFTKIVSWNLLQGKTRIMKISHHGNLVLYGIFEEQSCVRGYHIHQNVWTLPVEVLEYLWITITWKLIALGISSCEPQGKTIRENKSKIKHLYVHTSKTNYVYTVAIAIHCTCIEASTWR